MIIRKITLKAFNGRYSVVCEAEVFLKEKINFFYGKADAEVISIDTPGWFKSALGEFNWEYVKEKIKQQANTLSDGKNGMELIIKY